VSEPQRQELRKKIDQKVREKLGRKQRGTYAHDRDKHTYKKGAWLVAIEKVQKQHIFNAMALEHGSWEIVNS